jgi:hypothetical protein
MLGRSMTVGPCAITVSSSQHVRRSYRSHLTTDGISGRRGFFYIDTVVLTAFESHSNRVGQTGRMPKIRTLDARKTSQRASFVTDQRIAGFAYC